MSYSDYYFSKWYEIRSGRIAEHLHSCACELLQANKKHEGF